MARKNYGKKPLYPKGWPRILRAILYLQQKERKAEGVFPSVTSELRPSTSISTSTEMSDYG